MFKTIIPDLVSIDTDLKSLNGFVMCQNFDFFPETKSKNKHHYTLKLDNDISPPADYDFRSEYYSRKGKIWYYSRQVFFWHPSFTFDTVSKTLTFNHDYLYLPISLGGIFTIGEHLSNLIDLDLFLDGYLIMRGIAYRDGKKNICLSAPGFNGKTSLLKSVLKSGSSYIAEDYLVIDIKNMMVYPTCPLISENFWRRRTIDKEMSILMKKQSIITTPMPIDEILATENSQSELTKPPKRKFVDCLLLNSLYFLNNLFIKSIIYDRGLTDKILIKINEAVENGEKVKYIHTQNYNFRSTNKT